MELITSSAKLKERIAKLQETAEFVCVDTEFVREKTYYPTLGLIQIAYNDVVFAIDPIENAIDLEPLNEMLSNEKIIKVFHACSQDLEIFYHLFNNCPRNMFDTQVGAKMLGFGEAISYGKLVEHYLRKHLDKSHRYTDWTRRPLDQEQLDYAALDVVYLVNIFEKMRTELMKKGRYSWAVEESDKCLNEDNYHINIDECWRKLKVKSGDKSYLSILKSLSRWREVTAQNQNRPRPWILKDDAIQEIAAVKPKKPGDLQGLRFFKYDERLVGDILGVVDYALNEETPPKPEKPKHFPESAMPVLVLLRVLLKSQSVKHDIAPSVIADLEDLEDIATGDYKHSKAMNGWRYEIFGKYAQKLKEGKLALTADGSNIVLIEPAYEH